MEQDRGRVELPIGREPGHPTRRRIDPQGQSALTEYAVEGVFPGGSLLRLRPLTGRTHQIRVHMAALGHPLYGDRLYGGEGDLDRPALHSARILLRHPVTGEQLDLSAPLPEDLRRIMEK
jgi:23S rRNA-/tRNA-specific pseudouridylate synthase